MSRVRIASLALLAVMTGGSLLTTGGYAWYLRSAWYRAHCADLLSAHLDLPTAIGRVVPRSRQAREFQAVRVWLPGRRGEAAFCDRAVLTHTPDARDPEAFELDLQGGRCEISTRTWLREDYRDVLESGLRPGFGPSGPRRVVFSGMDVAFDRERFRLVLDDASGVVLFDEPNIGRAAMTCQRLNGFAAEKPVTLAAEFSPQATGIRLDRVDIHVPELPLAIAGIDALVGWGVRSGTFSGSLVYRESGAGHSLSLSGKAFDIRLAECTAALFDEPWRGVAPELELAELTVENGVPIRARFRGVFKGVVLGDVLEPWGMGEAEGQVTLDVQTAELSADGIERLVVNGHCDGIELEALARTLGRGRMTGRARLSIENLNIVSNRLAALDVEIDVPPDAADGNWIDREFLSEMLRRTLGVSLPDFLPERFRYARLGLRLEVRDEVLYVLGTHGPRQKAILSIVMADQEIPVVMEPSEPVPLTPWLDQVRARLTAEAAARLRSLTPAEAWRALSAPGRGSGVGSPASRPGRRE